MLQIGAFEAKNKLGNLLDRVEQGEKILITRHGKPVAQLCAPQPQPFNEQAARQAYAEIRAMATEIDLGPFYWEEFKKDLDAGRR